MIKKNKDLLNKIVKTNSQVSVKDLRNIQNILENNIYLEKKHYDIGVPSVDNRKSQKQTLTNVYFKNC